MGLIAVRRGRVTLAAALLASVAIVSTGSGAAATPAPQSERVAGHTAGTPRVLRYAKSFPLRANAAYDLDSQASNWDYLFEQPWISQNVQYLPTGDNGKPILLIAEAPATDVLLGTRGPWNYQRCENAHWDQSYTDNPNIAAGSALNPGHALCIETVKSAFKIDGGHLVLLKILARTSAALTVQITVWQ